MSGHAFPRHNRPQSAFEPINILKLDEHSSYAGICECKCEKATKPTLSTVLAP